MPDKPPSSPRAARSDRPRPGWPDALAALLATITGLACVLGVFVLIGVDKLAPAEGLPWIVATLSGLGVLQRNGSARK